MRAIDADELVKTLSEEAVHILKQAFSDYSTAEARGIVTAIDSVKKTPTIEPVKHGHWEYDGDCFICTSCRKAIGFLSSKCVTDFCPYCGAKMDGDGE